MITNDCKLWGKSTDRSGYGQLVTNGKRYLAHRLAYCKAHNLEYSDIKGNLVRHKCDNPSCVNPEHLELGTHQDNMDDRNTRGRTASGEDHGRAKLSTTDIENIRLQYVKGSRTYGLSSLAKKYGVAFQTISKIVNHKLWN